MIFSSNPVRTNATQATCTRSFQERVLSFPDLNLLFYNVLESPVTQITETMVTIATSWLGELGPLGLLEQNICIRIFLPRSFRPTLDNFVVDDSVLSNFCCVVSSHFSKHRALIIKC